MMSVDFLKDQLRRNSETFSSLLLQMDASIYAWKPDPSAWSILEILCHLVDEEKEDFRLRMKYAIDKKISPHMIDPVGWVIERNYAAQDFNSKLDEFLNERASSLMWLSTLDNKDLNGTWEHPKLGPLTAHHFASNWIAHDLLHTRQIIRNKYQYILQVSDNNCDYAGKWA